MDEKVIVIGGGGHARVLLDILKINKVDVLGYVDVRETGLPIAYLGSDEVLLNKYSSEEVILVNGVGSAKRPEDRQRIFEKFKSLKYQFISVVHPRSIIAESAEIGEGVQIMANVVLNPGVSIEDNVIINTSASIDHDCHIGAHTHIAPGVTFSGNVTVGKGCLVGTGAVVIQGITIGDKVLVGAGEVIRRDVEKGKRVIS